MSEIDALGSFGSSDSAALVREKLMNRLVASGKIAVTEDSSIADAILNGAVGVDLYGRADTAAIRLVSKDGVTLWGGEASTRASFGSMSSRIADQLAKELLKAKAQDNRP
jgi:hypothetical protein